VHSIKSVCILGKAVTGEAVESFFRSLPNPPTINYYTDDAEVTDNYDLAVVSPGIPPHSPMVVSALRHAGEMIGEPELAYRVSPGRWIVITGTNGKTTTTALIAHVLNACGIKARVAGNIGNTCIEAICQRDLDEYIVAELSSYQLAYSNTLTPDAAVLLNITPDHISWHGSFEAYRDAKLGLFWRLGDETPAVVDATLEETRSFMRARKAAGGRVIPLGNSEGLSGDMTVRCGAAEAAFVDARTNILTCVVGGRRYELIEASLLHILGRHNQQNALAAAAVALALGADLHKLRDGLASFEPLEHRIEPCGLVDGVSFYNDSKATNPEATLKAIDAFGSNGKERSLIIMLGGTDKNTPLDELVASCERVCKTAICYGKAGARFMEAFVALGQDPGLNVFMVDSFASAFAFAVLDAQPGDVVLLSPACSSFDEFDSYGHRGRVFKQMVAALANVGEYQLATAAEQPQELPKELPQEQPQEQLQAQPREKRSDQSDC